MAFDKVVEAKIFGVTAQNSTVVMPVGDSSAGTFTPKANPLRGTLLWDDCYYVLQGVSVAGGATGGSYTVAIVTNAVVGYTALPIVQTLATVGPLTKGTLVLDNQHKSKASPVPTHVVITQTAAGGAIWFQCHAVAKQYRGTLSSPGAKTSERIIQGNLIRGTSTGGMFASDAGVAADATFTLGTTGSTMGMHKLRTWDAALYWAVAGVSLSGTHDVNLVSRIGGNTFTYASTGVAGALTAAGQKIAIPSLVYGQSPNPRQIIWDVVSAGGVSDFRVVVLAKSGRGSMAKS